jgi:hypothetical protein
MPGSLVNMEHMGRLTHKKRRPPQSLNGLGQLPPLSAAATTTVRQDLTDENWEMWLDRTHPFLTIVASFIVADAVLEFLKARRLWWTNSTQHYVS